MTDLDNDDLQHFSWCTNKVKLPCDLNEGRRTDGTCNNLHNPSRGALHTPNARILPANYDPDFGPRKAKSGEPSPEPRHLRTSLVTEGDVPDQVFTHLATHFMIHFWNDVVNVHDTINYATSRTYCCAPEGKLDSMCAPIKVPHDDPVHRFTNVRCMNNTRPITYQSQGCVANSTIPSRLTTTTPFVDLSNVYGNGEPLQKARLFQKGLLKYEVEEGRIWPPSVKGPNSCDQNQLPYETRCHDSPVPDVNRVLGANIGFIWSWRLHNFIASELYKLNPCWNDEKLFNTARDIHIAMLTHIAYYELFPQLIGSENLLQDGVISASTGFRDLYDDQEVPQTYIEFPFIGRWVHTIQPGKISLYDTNGNYLRQYPEVNLTLRTGWLAVDNNIDYMTLGATRQPLAKIDYTVDSLVAQTGMGARQYAHDLLTYDLTKNRYFGLAPYIKYRDFCSGKTHTTFDDLADVIDPDRLEMLQNQYENVEDVDLISGIWLERKIDGGHVPPTFYCIVVEQLLKNMRMDRHWYERPNRPNAFTFAQLNEIWKSSAARVLCDVGDKVTKIQPNAFFRERDGLEMLQNQYENVEDVDLISGIWLERKIDGGHVPPTFYCIVVEQLLKNMRMDRHWYERPNRPNAFTFAQLNEIWKSSAARVLCDVGDKVTKIQPNAFFRERDGNRAVPCDEITNINWDAWKDNSCQMQ